MPPVQCPRGFIVALGYNFFKIDIDKEPSIASNYNIMSIPTILIFKDGELVKEIIGFRRKDELEKIIGEVAWKKIIKL